MATAKGDMLLHVVFRLFLKFAYIPLSRLMVLTGRENKKDIIIHIVT